MENWANFSCFHILHLEQSNPCTLCFGFIETLQSEIFAEFSILVTETAGKTFSQNVKYLKIFPQ